MFKIGPIISMQIQPASIKVGKPERYDPTRLLVVNELLLSQSGVIGVTQEGQHIIDVHNALHPATKSRGDNGFSLGFTSHYQSLRQHFGDHMTDACAGENILVQTDTLFSPIDLQHGLVIEQRQTGEYISFTDVQPVVPCLPFATYAAHRPLAPSEVKETLQFLMNGQRGFLAEVSSVAKTVTIRTGDVLYHL